MSKACLNCGSSFSTRHQTKYCTNKCQQEFAYKAFVSRWKRGLESGIIGINSRSLSRFIQRYLIDYFGEKCSLCGWKQVHPITKKVPLEIDHIDGNAENNQETNLRLLCPNCHSLTPYFRNLNAGRGRKWRIDVYRKNRTTSSLS